MTISEVDNNCIVEYNIKVVSFEEKQVIFKINGNLFVRSANSFHDMSKNLDIVLEHAYLLQEKIIDVYDDNGQTMLKIKNLENVIYNMRLLTYKYVLEFRYKFINAVYDNGHELLTSYINKEEHVLIDFHCGHGPRSLSPDAYYNKNTRCPICSQKKIYPKINDVYALRPDLLKYFINEEDAIGMGLFSSKKMNFKCPICGAIRKNTIGNISRSGFSCHVCGNGVSSSERIMKNILDQLNVQYKFHEWPEWGKYIFDEKIRQVEYDFILTNEKIIIEMDGSFHYIETKYHSLEEQQKIDSNKNRLAIENGYDIIRIDCNYYNEDILEYVKSSIYDKLLDILNLNDVDWNQVYESLLSSQVKQCCDLWNQGYSSIQIAKITKLCHQTVVTYLTRGDKNNLCNYNRKLATLRQAKQAASKFYYYAKVINLSNNDIIGVFYDTDNFIYNYYKKYGQILCKQSIQNVSKGKSKYMKSKLGFDMDIVRIDINEYQNLIEQKDLVNDIVELDQPFLVGYCNENIKSLLEDNSTNE